MQLVQPGLVMLDTMKNRTIGPDEVREKFGVPPDKVVDVQALAGDSTDNVPGVPGIGVKTAAELINEYGDLETLLARAGEIKQPKRRERLTEFAMQARLSRDLVTLKDDVPVEVPVEQLGVREPEPEALLGFLREMEFATLTKRIAEGLRCEAPPPVERPAAATARGDRRPASAPATPAEARRQGAPRRVGGDAAGRRRRWRRNAAKAQKIDRSQVRDRHRAAAARSLDRRGARRRPLRLRHRDHQPRSHAGRVRRLLDGRGARQGLLRAARASRRQRQLRLRRGRPRAGADPRRRWPCCKPLLEDAVDPEDRAEPQVRLPGARAGTASLWPRSTTPCCCPTRSMAAAASHGMDALAERHLGHTCIPFAQVLEHAPGAKKSDKTFAQVPLDKATEYAAEDADVTLRLWMVLKPRLAAERMATVYETLERPLVAVLADMERAGVKVDRAILSRLTSTFAQRIARLEEEIYELAGHKFNLGSPKQLGEFLFDSLKLPGGRKTKTGQWETRANLLDDLAAREDLPEDARKLINVMLEWRQLAKLRSTYTDSLPQHINPETGRIHTSYALASTTTGRLASTDPNLQNIPIRTKEGREIRTAFIAERGHKLISADYSQIELRVLAHVADIPQLTQGFRGGPRHSRHDGVRDVRRRHRGHAARGAPARQGHQLRHHLRHLGVRAGGPARHLQAGGGRVHRHLFQALPRHSRLHGSDQESGRTSAGSWRPFSAGACTIPRSTPRTRRCAGFWSAPPSTRRSRARPPISSAAP